MNDYYKLRVKCLIGNSEGHWADDIITLLANRNDLFLWNIIYITSIRIEVFLKQTISKNLDLGIKDHALSYIS